MVAIELLDTLYKLDRREKFYVIQALLNHLADTESIGAREPSKQGAIDQRIPNLRKGKGWVADDFDAPLPDEFWLGEANATDSRY